MSWRFKTREELASWQLANPDSYKNWASPEMDYLYGLPITLQEVSLIVDAIAGYRSIWYPDKNPGRNSNWTILYFHITEDPLPVQEFIEQREFQVGDLVITNDMPRAAEDKSPDDLVIAKIKELKYYLVYSKEWESKDIGHDGDGYSKAGCWSVYKLSLTLKTIQKNEVPRQDFKECPRGTESDVHCRTIEIASSSRPIGSEATNFRIGRKAESGSIQYNKLQSNKSS